MRFWLVFVGALLGSTIIGIFFHHFFRKPPFLLPTEMMATAQDVSQRHPNNVWDRLSMELANMQQNITGVLVSQIASLSIKNPSGQAPLGFPPFLQTMAQFPWAEALNALDNDRNQSARYFQQLLDTLVPYLVTPPQEPKDKECLPPAHLTEDLDKINCGHYTTAFTGSPRETPAKIAHILQLGFDADVLEIQLNELHWVVDKIFIMESTRTHNKNLRKPLLWDRLKSQPRFQRFADKTVHIVLDDVDVLAANHESIWGLEVLQEKMRWEAFLAWNNRTDEPFGLEDVVGFGDADEIPSSHNLRLLKRCKMAGPSIDIGTWFAWGRLDRAFKPDWPVPDNPWTLGDPTYWTVRSAMAFSEGADGQYPSRMRGKSGHYLLGGIHMTDNGYLPFLLAKIIACTECEENSKETLRKLGDCFAGKACQGLSEIEVAQNIFNILDRAVVFKARIADVESMKAALGEAYHVPWLIECSPEKFPAWFGNVDGRVLAGKETSSPEVKQA